MGQPRRVMDSLMEALKTGSAFSRDQKRKRAARPAGAERRAQLNRSRSKGRVGHPDNREIVDILLEEEENLPGLAAGAGGAGGVDDDEVDQVIAREPAVFNLENES